jgi:superfamily II DNA or RNA helicase
MPDLVQFGKKLWSWISPPSVEVRITTELLPSGQMLMETEYWLDNQRLTRSELGAEATGTRNGFRFRVPPVVREISAELADGPQRVRPKAAKAWLKRFADKQIKVIGRSGDRPVVPTALTVDLSLELEEDDSLRTQAILSTPTGIEVDAGRLQPIADEPGWFQLDGQLFERQPHPPAVEAILAEPLVLRDQAVPTLLDSLQPPPEGFNVEKNERLSSQVILREPKNTIQIDATPDAISVDQVLIFDASSGTAHREPMAAAERLLGDEKSEPRYRRVPGRGWARIGRKDLDAAAESRQQLPSKFAPGASFAGHDIPEALSTLNELAKSGSLPVIQLSDRVKHHHDPIDTPASATFMVSVVEAEGAQSVIQLAPVYQHGGHTLPHPEVAETLRRSQKWVRRPRAWVKVDREKFKAVEAVAAQQKLTPAPDGFTFSAANRDVILGYFAAIGRVEQDASYYRFLQQLATFNGIEPVPLPRNLRDDISLYPYQQQGYHWLAFLRRYGLNGVLADDMGLGKTLQTLTAIFHSVEIGGLGGHHPSLIICPVSLLANWEAEARRFFKNLIILQYRGNDRASLRRKFDYVDLVLTSYTIAVNDMEELAACPWNYVVLDEAHNIKNPETQRTRNIKRLVGHHKLSLTGTPVQNAPSDLWSQFDFLMPGYLGSHGEFKTQCSDLVLKKSASFNPQAAEALRKRIDPFILRRLKKDVALDLPEKIIADRIIELSEAQVRAYKSLLNTTETRALRQSIERNDYSSKSVHILALLTRLRQICGHPALIDRDPDRKATESSKLDALLELCLELREGGHRALVFSQFTSMLDLIAVVLQDEEFPFLRIDGSTPSTNRQPLVDQFNRDSRYTCMLLSTKAGGTGLNLTGADTVIFYDHDWNPANDQQAQDRAYRIGQKRNVTVYRLITKGTVEEKMIRIQERKVALAEALVGIDEGGMKNITREELLSLFELDTN